jgi:hypothetical protein
MSGYKKPYSTTFKEQMVELGLAGKAPKKLSQEFGCHVDRPAPGAVQY